MSYTQQHATAYTATTGFDANLANPGNAYADDAAYATADTGRNKEMATNFRGFDFSGIPDGSTITSVTVGIKKKLSAAWSQGQWRCSVWPDVTVAAALTSGTTGAFGPNLQYTDDTNTATEETWYAMCSGTLPTLAQLKAANFGVRVQGSQGNNGTIHTWSVNDIYITVNYLSATAHTKDLSDFITISDSSITGRDFAHELNDSFSLSEQLTPSVLVSKNTLRYYDGSKWLRCLLKYYNGTAWVPIDLKTLN